MAPMPGLRDNETQSGEYDYAIAANTFIFNNLSKEDRPVGDNGLHLEGEEPVDLDPSLVKAIICIESTYGKVQGGKRNGTSDIMQSNVYFSEKSNDWGDYKKAFGLEKGKSATPIQSIYAGIRILYLKGLKSTPIKNKKGKITGYRVSWRGKNLNSWKSAVQRYNAKNPNYSDDVYDIYNEIIFNIPTKEDMFEYQRSLMKSSSN